jgi:predicted nucleic acid-binding protein
MIIIVETNFILELVLQQAHHEACEELLAMNTAGDIQLTIPSFSVAEAGMMLERTGRERRRFINEERARQSSEVGTGQVLRRYEAKLVELEDELLKAQEESDKRWRHFRIGALQKLKVIPLSDETLDEAFVLQHSREVERWPDALVFGSVRAYLESLRTHDSVTPAVFVSTDKAAFKDSRIIKQLRKLECSSIHSFKNAIQRLRHHLG